jgi:hypothetical protein
MPSGFFYTVSARARSLDGAAHTFGEHVVINGQETNLFNKSISRTSYAWYSLGTFFYNGSSLRLADWSDPNLSIDRLKIEGFITEMYMAISTDGGRTFNVQPNPVISSQSIPGLGRVVTSLDPDVIRLADGYYMLFEGFGDGCTAPSSYIAYSADGLTNWQVKNASVCTTNWDGGARAPNFVKDAQSNQLYIHWVSIYETPEHITTRHQAQFKSNLFDRITTDVRQGQLPQSPPDKWDGKNFGSGNVMYEDGYYYLFYEGANDYKCAGQWGIGLARTNNIASPTSWEKLSRNPLLWAALSGSCWISYPEIIKVNNDYYLYYEDPFPYWQEFNHTRTIFRRKIVTSP